MKVNPIELKYWREKSVLTRAELAEKAGIARSTYYAIERGSQPTARAQTIRKIAAALEITPDKLVEVIRPPDLIDVRVDHTARARVSERVSGFN